MSGTPKGSPKVVLWRSWESNLRPLVYKALVYPLLHGGFSSSGHSLVAYFKRKLPNCNELSAITFKFKMGGFFLFDVCLIYLWIKTRESRIERKTNQSLASNKKRRKNYNVRSSDFIIIKSQYKNTSLAMINTY